MFLFFLLRFGFSFKNILVSEFYICCQKPSFAGISKIHKQVKSVYQTPKKATKKPPCKPEVIGCRAAIVDGMEMWFKENSPPSLQNLRASINRSGDSKTDVKRCKNPGQTLPARIGPRAKKMKRPITISQTAKFGPFIDFLDLHG